MRMTVRLRTSLSCVLLSEHMSSTIAIYSCTAEPHLSARGQSRHVRIIAIVTIDGRVAPLSPRPSQGLYRPQVQTHGPPALPMVSPMQPVPPPPVSLIAKPVTWQPSCGALGGGSPWLAESSETVLGTAGSVVEEAGEGKVELTAPVSTVVFSGSAGIS
ncbi:MAG: hypothetical protein J3R72DRAFT_516973 [Linnemannia gamsii]|nr:MAG: hypothetical protein J3R72DRAFT_516973 [Linnemannia gamsii]